MAEYTDADTKLVAMAMAANGMFHDGCGGGCEDAARAVLSALAADGRLRPPGELLGVRTADGRLHHPADVTFVYEGGTDG